MLLGQSLQLLGPQQDYCQATMQNDICHWLFVTNITMQAWIEYTFSYYLHGRVLHGSVELMHQLCMFDLGLVSIFAHLCSSTIILAQYSVWYNCKKKQLQKQTPPVHLVRMKTCLLEACIIKLTLQLPNFIVKPV